MEILRVENLSKIYGKGGVAEQDGLTADGKWVFLVRLRRGKLDKLLVHQIVKGNLRSHCRLSFKILSKAAQRITVLQKALYLRWIYS